jgi:hypothetical protein
MHATVPDSWQWHVLYSGDFGIGFFGHSHNSAAYVLHGELNAGWLCFLCNIKLLEEPQRPAGRPPAAAGAADPMHAGLEAVVVISPRDSYHKRIYIQPLGLYIVAEAGTFAQLQLDMRRQRVNVSFAALAEQLTSRVRLRVEFAAEDSQAAGLHDSQAAGLHVESVGASTRVACIGAALCQRQHSNAGSGFLSACEFAPSSRSTASWLMLEWSWRDTAAWS